MPTPIEPPTPAPQANPTQGKRKAAFFVATHFRQNLLKLCLQRLVAQRVPQGWEIEILVAGKPEDPGKQVALSFPGIRYIDAPTSVVTDKENACLAATTAELVMLADDDDLQPVNRAEEAIKAHEEGYGWSGVGTCWFYDVANDCLSQWKGAADQGLIGTSMSYDVSILRAVGGWPEAERGKDGRIARVIKNLSQPPKFKDLTSTVSPGLVCLQHGQNLWARPVLKAGETQQRGLFRLTGFDPATLDGLPRPAPSQPTTSSQPATQAQNTGTAPTKLHIACGPKHIEGYLNTDLRPGPAVDQVLDAREPLPTSSYDEIYACHVLEHFYPDETPGVLTNWFQALRPGGVLRLAVPDIRLIVANCVESHTFGNDLNAPLFGRYQKNAEEPDRHKQAFCRENLAALLQGVGFVDLRQWVSSEVPEIGAVKDWSSNRNISLNLLGHRPGTTPPPQKVPVPTSDLIPKPAPGTPLKIQLRSVDTFIGHIMPHHTTPLDCSVILGTVDRPVLLQECVRAIRQGVITSSYEIVVAYGTDAESSLPWMAQQEDIRPVLGGMAGAIPAFNIAYRESRGRYICQINDDVQVDPGSIQNAIDHLEAHPEVAGVVFRFDRKDGQGYHCQYTSRLLHPNQIVVRREVCEAVIQHLGAFWGDENHRTDKTYGGDSAFGVMCHHLGFQLVELPNVTCVDDKARTKGDHLRVQNEALTEGHPRRWREMYLPLLTSRAEPAGEDEWPHVYLPRIGMKPQRSPLLAGPPERVLHLGLRGPYNSQLWFTSALSTLGPYRQIPWALWIKQFGAAKLEQLVLDAIREHKPTLIFCQIQGGEWPSVEFLHQMKKEAPSDCVLLNWTGDVRTRQHEPCQRWQVRMCHGVDLFLASNCDYPLKLKRDERVPCTTGYVICGTQGGENPWIRDPDLSQWGPVAEKAVFVGNRHPWSNDRDAILTSVSQEMPGQLFTYGAKWSLPDSRGPISREQRAHLHGAAAVVVGASAFHDLRRYTSGRLTDSLHSGAVYAMEAFPDWEGLGLRHGENVLVWNTEAELKELLKDWLRPERAADRARIRQAAHELAVNEFIWESVMENFLAIIRDFRQRRGG